MAINLKEIIKDGVDTAFTQFGDIVEEVEIIFNSNRVYDVSSGDYSSKNSEMVVVNGIFTETSQMELMFGEIHGQKITKGSASIGDKKLLVKAEELANRNLEIDMEIFRRSENRKFIIVNFSLDPTKNLYEIRLKGVV